MTNITFKSGDRVKLTKSCSGMEAGTIRTLIQSGYGLLFPSVEGQIPNGCLCRNLWELEEPAKPEPKVGDRVKIIRCYSRDPNHTGKIGTVLKIRDDATDVDYDVDYR